MGEGINHIETIMGVYSTSFITLVNAHSDHREEIAWLKDKIADLEERSRRNNIKIRGIPEAVAAPQLQQYRHTLFSSLILSLSPIELTVDRIHRVLKPSFHSDDTPRDVLLKVHYYHVKKR